MEPVSGDFNSLPPFRPYIGNHETFKISYVVSVPEDVTHAWCRLKEQKFHEVTFRENYRDIFSSFNTFSDLGKCARKFNISEEKYLPFGSLIKTTRDASTTLSRSSKVLMATRLKALITATEEVLKVTNEKDVHKKSTDRAVFDYITRFLKNNCVIYDEPSIAVEKGLLPYGRPDVVVCDLGTGEKTAVTVQYKEKTQTVGEADVIEAKNENTYSERSFQQLIFELLALGSMSEQAVISGIMFCRSTIRIAIYVKLHDVLLASDDLEWQDVSSKSLCQPGALLLIVISMLTDSDESISWIGKNSFEKAIKNRNIKRCGFKQYLETEDCLYINHLQVGTKAASRSPSVASKSSKSACGDDDREFIMMIHNYNKRYDRKRKRSDSGDSGE